MLKVHFLNVGHGDCCVIEFPIEQNKKRIAVIDINRSKTMDEESLNEVLKQLLPSAKSFLKEKLSIEKGYRNSGLVLLEKGYDIELTDPIKYIKDDIDKNSIFRFISTHPHMDHLSGLYKLSENFSISNLWIIKNKYEPDLDKLSDHQKEDWNFYKYHRDNDDNSITVIRPQEGSQAEYYQQDGVNILAPTDDLIKEAMEKNKPNIMSYVLLIKYGKCKIILGGDAEESTWKYICDKYEKEISNVSILKASHHGRDSGYYQPAVQLMNPVCTVVSVGKKPDTDASNKYRNYCDNVWSTRWKGNIIFYCYEDGKIEYKTQYDR